MNFADLVLSPATWWIIICAVLVLVELVTMGLTTIWFAGGALVAAIVAFFGGGIPLQIIAFLVVSILLLFATRPIAVKYFNKSRVKTNADSLVGKTGIVTKTINNIKAEGTVEINGMEWTARSVEDETEIPEGTLAEVIEIQGVKLIVRGKGEV